MKFYINTSANRTVSKIITISVVSILNLAFIIFVLLLSVCLFSYGFSGKYFLFFIIVGVFSILPIAGFLLNKIHNFIKPAIYKDLYFKIMDSILGITSPDEIVHKIFYSIIKFMGAGFGSIVYYSNESDVIEIKYNSDGTYKALYHEKSEYDDILLKRLTGHDIIIRNEREKAPSEDMELMNVFEQLNADIIVPIYYNEQVFGVIIIGRKKGFSEREIKLLKMVAYKLAQLSVNSYYFSEITKGKEVEKEYELISRIQKQFLPEPSLEYGRIRICAYHNTVASLTREFYDIFVNEGKPDEILTSAYRVSGDVKEISILMPGIQAMLQSYARLGFSPKTTMSKIRNIIKERNLISGDLMIFHSQIHQSGEFDCCCFNYPAPFCYRNSEKKLVRLAAEKPASQYIKADIGPGDIILSACRCYSDILKNDTEKYFRIIHENCSRTLEEIRDILVNELDKTDITGILSEDEDRLLLLITLMEEN